eukprot:TRINITY_DN6741_c0_g1_i1.p1 TRINITY_DN6741_c0_g1~~TRINITY_DN6741_c0_g1_i1.p1  ORF type:complete len:223 (-),score=-15.40 TRINITY_DN6741_c0_g1_i1:99-767(-)
MERKIPQKIITQKYPNTLDCSINNFTSIFSPNMYVKYTYIHTSYQLNGYRTSITSLSQPKTPSFVKQKIKIQKVQEKTHQIMEMTTSRFTQGCNIDFLFTCNYLISLANLIEIRTYKYKTTQGKLNLKEANNLQYIYIYIFFVALVRIYKYEYIRDKTNRVQNQFKKGQQSTIYIYIQILLQFSQEPTNTIYKQQNQPCEKNNQKKVSTIHKYILLQLCSVI